MIYKDMLGYGTFQININILSAFIFKCLVQKNYCFGHPSIVRTATRQFWNLSFSCTHVATYAVKAYAGVCTSRLQIIKERWR